MTDEGRDTGIQAIVNAMATRASELVGESLRRTREGSAEFQANLDKLMAPLEDIERKLRDRASALNTAQGLAGWLALTSIASPVGGSELAKTAEEVSKAEGLSRSYSNAAESARKLIDELRALTVEDRDSAQLVLEGFKAFLDEAARGWGIQRTESDR